jgi:hypothetical protein
MAEQKSGCGCGCALKQGNAKESKDQQEAKNPKEAK